ncbi:RluA family pseudouridine synthase [Sphaerotilus sp.]|uniref:RluA family pseudouridine synthase n=1 Tax=Sphaerotilus sp. TaxID=2093942 RepID=UPI00286DB4BE|nr:RluA family pseudouridine synthase [Sphaerotilus sp.]
MHPPDDSSLSPDIDLLHVDEALVVVRKPAGLLSVPGRGPERADCMSARVQQRLPDALVVHRLDMATSGLLLMARGAAAQRLLSAAFAERQVAKRYTAVVAGQIDADHGEVNLPLICDWPNRPRQMVDHVRGKPALTRWRVLSRQPAAGTTRVELEPVTGRSHQLRVHLQSIGHPIVGDELYAATQWQQAAPRLLLHACHLAFAHPLSGAALAFDDPAAF